MEQFSQQPILEHSNEETIKYLIFEIGHDAYGVEITFVNEIIGVQQITEVPEQPKYVLGIINLRGKIIPVMDVRLRFKKPSREFDDRTCIIVVEIMETLVGLIIDRVVEVIDIHKDQIADPPKINADFKNRFIQGIGKTQSGVKILLNCAKLLSETELMELSKIEE